MQDWRQLRVWTRDEMLKRVARFKDLKGSDGGLPDSDVPECRRTLYNVIGFQPPRTRATRRPPRRSAPTPRTWRPSPSPRVSTSATAARNRARGRSCTTTTRNETFIAMTGRWRCEWNEGPAQEHVDLEPLDVISFPVGVARRFMNVTYDEPDKEHVLMFVIGGNEPQAEFTPAAMKRCEEWQRQVGKR